MNRRDRERMGRLYGLIAGIPLPHDGSGRSTASLQGMVEYQADMRVAIPMILDCLMQISRDDDPMSEPDGALDELEDCLAERLGEMT